jgi:hypothetical protein
MGNRSNRRGRPRRWIAVGCLGAVLAFAGLDATHSRDLKPVQQRGNSGPCLVCQLASSTLLATGHAAPPPIAPAPEGLGGEIAPSAPVAQPRSLPDIRPPPASNPL